MEDAAERFFDIQNLRASVGDTENVRARARVCVCVCVCVCV